MYSWICFYCQRLCFNFYIYVSITSLVSVNVGTAKSAVGLKI